MRQCEEKQSRAQVSAAAAAAPGFSELPLSCSLPSRLIDFPIFSFSHQFFHQHTSFASCESAGTLSVFQTASDVCICGKVSLRTFLWCLKLFRNAAVSNLLNSCKIAIQKVGAEIVFLFFLSASSVGIVALPEFVYH